MTWLLLILTPRAARRVCAGSAGVLISTGLAFAAQNTSPNQQLLDPAYLKPGSSRTFTIEYVGQISGIPAGTKQLRVWLPVPQDSPSQTIRDLKFSLEPQFGVEPKYGNKIAFFSIANPESSASITMSFSCTRLETIVDLDQVKTDGKDAQDSFEVFKKADKLVTVDREIKKLSDEICAGKTTTVEKARAIYDYALTRMTYDKTGTGWGTGSTKFACEVGKGNCTDFHALFNSLCRAQGIASGFEIGLYLPYERNQSEEKLGGYHCWAFFRVPGKTWVPVDCSEADRFPERASYFFGAHTPNRITLSTGRDIDLVPQQAGPPLNYFLNPYAEADGQPIATNKSWSFKEAS
jgi:transglutaminase-like putative cysteine protease